MEAQDAWGLGRGWAGAGQGLGRGPCVGRAVCGSRRSSLACSMRCSGLREIGSKPGSPRPRSLARWSRRHARSYEMPQGVVTLRGRAEEARRGEGVEGGAWSVA